MRYLRWRDAIKTLAKFHTVKPASVNLTSFGKPLGFYNRQLNTFNTIQTAQASAKDKDTGDPVGKIPHFDDMVAFFGDPKTQPEDRSTFVHGDYKIDNLVFHKTEPRVIGILEFVLKWPTLNLRLIIGTVGKWQLSVILFLTSPISSPLSPPLQYRKPGLLAVSTSLL